jgi:Phage integrase family/Putative transposase
MANTLGFTSLRDYYRQYRPTTWLFPGQTHKDHLSIGQVQRLCRQAMRACGITQKASMHTLRHSYATHLLESGTDLATLQILLGHNQLSTTVRYIDLQQSDLHRVRSPLDNLPRPGLPSGESKCAIPAWISEPSSARYTYRVAISNSRLTHVSDEAVTFTYKDYRRHGKSKELTQQHEEGARWPAE